MPRQKRQARTWHEPKGRKHAAPSMTAKAVAHALGFSSVESVHILARRGPERDGLPAYVPTASGIGWTRKIFIPKEEREAGYKRLSGVQLMFHADDVEAWRLAHPFVERDGAPVPYTAEERAIVLAEAELIKDPENGTVNRTLLMHNLAYERGTGNPKKKLPGIPRMEFGFGPSAWNARTYKKIKQILDDAGIQLPPQMPRDTTLRRPLRKYAS